MVSVIIVGLLLILAPWVSAADRYVDCGAGTNGSGTIGSPYNKFQNGLNGVSAGDTLHVHDGTICRVTTSQKTATAGPITITSYGGGDGIWKLRGSELLNSGWTDQGSNRWRRLLDVAAPPGRMVFIDGETQATWADINGTNTAAWNCPTDLNSDKEFCYSGGFLYVYSSTGQNPATRWTNPGVEVVNELVAQANQANRRVLSVDHANYTLRNGDIRHAGYYTFLALTTTTLENMDLSWSWLNNVGASNPDGANVIQGGTGTLTIRNSRIHDCGRDCFHIGSTSTMTLLLVEDTEWYNSFNHQAIGVISDGVITQAILRRNYMHDVCTGIMQTNAANSQTSRIVTLTIEDSYFKDGVLQSDARVFQPQQACGNRQYGVMFNTATAATATIVRRSIFENLAVGIDGLSAHTNSSITAENNVFYNNRKIGLDLSSFGGGMTVRNNIFSQNGGGTHPLGQDGQITCRDSGPCGTFPGRSFANVNNNLYNPHASSVVAFVSGIGDRTFAQWQAIGTGATDPDAAGINDNPDFVTPGTNFNLQPVSPAIGAGHNGSHMGALQTFDLTSCAIQANGTSIVCTHAMHASYSPMQACSANAGAFSFSCATTGVQAGQTCTPQGSNQTLHGVANPYQQGEGSCTVTYSAAVLEDSANIGSQGMYSTNFAESATAITNLSTVTGGGVGSLFTLDNRVSDSGNFRTDRLSDQLYDNCLSPDSCTAGNTGITSFHVVHDLGAGPPTIGDMILTGDGTGNWVSVSWTAEWSDDSATGPWTAAFTAEPCATSTACTETVTLAHRWWRITVNGPSPCVDPCGTQAKELQAFESGEDPPPPPTDLVIIQTRARCRKVGVAGEAFNAHSTLLGGLENADCGVVPGGLVQVRLQLENTVAPYPEDQISLFACDGTCETIGNWYEVSDAFGANLVALGDDPQVDAGSSTTAILTAATGTFTSGHFRKQGSSPPTISLNNQYTEIVYVIAVSASATPGQTILTRLQGDNETLFDSYTYAPIVIVGPRASR